MTTLRKFWPSALRSRPSRPFPFPLPSPVSQAKRYQSSKSQRTVAEYLDWRPSTEAADVVVNGYVRSVRTMKSDIFVHVGDGSTRKPLQALVPKQMAGGSGLRVGAAIRLRGSWVPSSHADQSHELKVSDVDILGPSDASTYPIQKKYQTPDYLRSIPHLRSRTPLNTAILRLRSDAVATLTQFFASRNFTQTHPPIITSSDCEGAGEVFTVSAGSAETAPKNKAEDTFFRGPKYLTVSTQLHLEALAQSLGNVWTLSPTFRAEKSDTSRHMSEFYMLEAEMPFVEQMDDVLDLVEDMLRHLATNLYTSRPAVELRERHNRGKSRTAEDDLVSVDEVDRRWAGMMQTPASKWPRITYTDAIDLLQTEAHRFEHKPTWDGGLHSEHEKFLAKTVGATGEQGIYRPVFVTHYPRDMKAFYMRTTATSPLPSSSSTSTAPQTAGSGDDCPSGTRQLGTTVDCFDLLVPDLCEIAGGSMREHRLAHLQEAMATRGMTSGNNSRSNLDWYVDLRRWGSCPHGGFGLGFDRLLSYLAGVQNVRDVVAFPRWFGRCDC
ncbi:asparaginyl-tRNA synthetase [Sodiomyces alkalinus F11]|uniref:Asparaginyl-tRNA synthetase n=1 Tax=Sodiomyces alkalinus (strain CBS 110278 / VKM F-3762 / F11) TaxID=1314773 RepID=A0A3N2PV56_SODAK|nr:asparaginyl-tRNA synthetase [Sodiomyces alkalinus F11]ROT38375.1 asparaginyl-tRNA synthetase [Sodiomyces alkalinus F11]